MSAMNNKPKEKNCAQNQSFDASINPNQLNVLVLPADVQLVLIKEEGAGEWRPGVDQQDPEPLNIKEEEEELLTSLGEEKLNIKEQTDVPRFPYTAVPWKNEDGEEKPLMYQLPQHQVVPASSSTDQMTAATGGEDCGGSETIWNPGTLNTQEEESSSSQTEVSDDDDEDKDNVNTPDSQLLDTGSKTEDGNNNRMEIRSPESGVDTVKTNRKVQTRRKSYSCDLCGKTFSQKSYLEIHTRIHSGERPFYCEDCGQSFTRKSHLHTHTRNHTGQRPFCCDDCGQSFNRMSTLNRHMIIHTGQRPFCCEDCGQSFTRKSHLDRHTNIHTGQRPFCCDCCELSFTRKAHLDRHMRIHTGQKPFCCDDCGQSFRDRSTLNRHMIIHTDQKPFCCDCGQSFSHKSTLSRHMRIHTGQRPFCCDFCGQSFRQTSHLNSHIRIHTGNKMEFAMTPETQEPTLKGREFNSEYSDYS